MKLTEAMCALLKKAAEAYHGAERRRYMAETVAAFDLSQLQAQLQLGPGSKQGNTECEHCEKWPRLISQWSGWYKPFELQNLRCA